MKLKKVHSLMELRNLAKEDSRYAELMVCAANNLGGGVPTGDTRAAYRELEMIAGETSDEGVVDEVNFCIPLIK